MMQMLLAKELALEIINNFPRAKNGKPFLTLANGKKLFFSIFIKKYGIDGSDCVYKDEDILRRIRLVEFFDYLTKHFGLGRVQDGNRLIIKSRFYTMVILKIGILERERYELLSFYHHKLEYKKTPSV